MSSNLEMAIAAFQADNLVQFVVPIFLTAVVIEAIWSRWGERGLYHGRDFAASMFMLLGSVLIEIVPKILAIAAMFQIHELSPLRDVVERQPWAWVLLFVLDDFTYYWFHRMNHEVRFFWAGHVNHHSSTYMNFGTALRQGVVERVYKPLFWLWLAALGFDPAMILVMMGLNLTYQFWTHTEAVRRLPKWYEAVLNTPSHHRVHHGSNVRYLDRNHGGVLIIWDKLFGTFSAELDEESVVYGLTTDIGTHSPWRVLTHGYTEMAADMRRSSSVGERLRYLLKAPGWSHDGPDRRAKTLRSKAGL
ncbi:MAG: sterol desaturase family protein [Myxococcota bacterium]